MIFLDANIFVDVLTAREGYEASLEIINSIRNKKEDGCLSALTIPILWYVLGEKRRSIAEIKSIIEGFNIVPLDPEIINTSFDSEMGDFEDAIQLNSAISGGSNIIITRNKKDFRSAAKVEILTPEELLSKK
jgi:predicted nucleic acid-binding protein